MQQPIEPIHIFRAGRHTAMSGDTLAFSASDLDATARAYDPALSAAPIVIGHPTTDAPAYGWVTGVAHDGDGLHAAADQVEPQFAELVRDGRYKRVSASFYTPDSPNNPSPGVYYLRHVGFLGAQAPAIKGLKTPQFAADTQGVIEFAELGDMLEDTILDRLNTGLRGWIRRLLNDPLALMDDSTAVEPGAAGFAATDPEDTTVTDDEMTQRAAQLQQQAQAQADKEAAFAEREAVLQQQEAQFAERASAAARADIVSYVESLVQSGRVLPRDQAGLVEFMAAQAVDGEIEFAEGDATVKRQPEQWLRGFLDGLPEQVDYAERGAAAADAGTAGTYEAPAGYQVDPRQAETHRKALAYAEQNKTDYVTAVRAVEQSA